MNVKSFKNDVGIAVNVDLDLVEEVKEFPDGSSAVRFGVQWVALGVAYREIEPQITAPNARRSPIPPPPPPPPPIPPAEGQSANNGGAESAAGAPQNP